MLTGGLRTAWRASSISKRAPSSFVPIDSLKPYPFTARLAQLGCQALNLSRPISTWAAFKGLYSVARSSEDNPIVVSYNIEARLRAEGLAHVVDALPAGLLNRLISIRLDLKESSNPDLISRSPGEDTVTVAQVLVRLNILEHVIELYKSLDMFKNARVMLAGGSLKQALWGRGNPTSVGEDGLVPSIPLILQLSDKINNMLTEPQVESAVYAGILLHDLGKFLRQAFHFENTYTMLTNNPILKNILAENFTPQQIGIIQNIGRYHSVFTDTIVCKETSILKPYDAIMGDSCASSDMRRLNNLLYVISICDTDAYLPGMSRLSNDRLEEISQTHADIEAAIASGKALAEIKKDADSIYLSWGRARFNSWVLAEDDIKMKRAENSQGIAREEITQMLGDQRTIVDFFKVIGALKHVGLIFDLRKELPDPISRARLLLWLYYYVKNSPCEKVEFQIYREKGKWAGPQVAALRKLLGNGFNINAVNAAFKAERKDDGSVVFILPE